MSGLIDKVIFPTTWADDLKLTAGDLYGSISISRAAAIADALRHKRRFALAARRAGKMKADEEILPGYPEVTLAITGEELAIWEGRPARGKGLAEVMNEICDSETTYFAKQARIKVAVSSLSKVLEVKSQGRFALSYPMENIAVIDRAIKTFDLRVGTCVYQIPLERDHIGIARLKIIAAAYPAGVSPAELGMNGRNSAAVRAYKTNVFLRKSGFGFLTLHYLNDLTYIHDALQPCNRKDLRIRAARKSGFEAGAS